MKLEGFLTVADRISDHYSVVHDEVTRLKIRIDKLFDSLKMESIAFSLTGDLRTCYRPPAFFYEGRPRCFFVRRYNVNEERELTELAGVIVKEVVRSGTWKKDVRSSNEGSWTVHDVELSGTEIARRTAALYADNAVRIGSFDEACREPCNSCGKEAFIVCRHDFDSEWGEQTLHLSRLCLYCMNVGELPSFRHRINMPNPLLPPSTPPRR